MTGLVVAAKLAERRLVQVEENIAERIGGRIPGGKTLPVDLAQGADRGGAVLVADFTILLAVVGTCLAHAALPLCRCCSILLPTGNGNRALQPEMRGRARAASRQDPPSDGYRS